MPWNWQLPQWPHFQYSYPEITQMEKTFLLGIGSAFAFLKGLEEQESHRFIVEILSVEGLESSKIEGEILDRRSLQSSIRKQFGLEDYSKKEGKREEGMAKLLFDVYTTFDEPLSHEMLYKWHVTLFKKQSTISEKGKYRLHPEPMQIVSNRYGSHKIFFEAPPSSKVFEEMDRFIDWFNTTRFSLTLLERAAVAHVYFESIHPFEDGNGRIGRVLVEKILSRGVGRATLIAISKVLEKRRKEYYSQLEKCNQTLEISEWMKFFSAAILQAQEESIHLLYFIIKKSKIMTALSGQLNPRQEKVLLKMFAEGPQGFKGGLTAEKYISIAKTSRATATRDLTDLVEKGALVKTGELRHTHYWLNLED